MTTILKVNPYKNLGQRETLYREADAMAEYSFSRGKAVPSKVIITLQSFEKYSTSVETVPPELLNDMVWSHHALAQLLSPATPRTILLLQSEREVNAWVRLLGPVSLVRHLMVAAVVSLLLFLGACVTSYTNYTAGATSPSIMSSEGVPLFVLLIQYLGAAGLGASFLCLYQANRFVTLGTFDPLYTGSYWIRFLLGLISGLLLAVIMKRNVLNSAILEPGIDRVLLAILGGFSAELFYTFLTRFVEACKSIFQGGADEAVAARFQQAKAHLATQQVESQTQIAASLMRVQQTIGATTSPEEIQKRLSELMNQILPSETGSN